MKNKFYLNIMSIKLNNNNNKQTCNIYSTRIDLRVVIQWGSLLNTTMQGVRFF